MPSQGDRRCPRCHTQNPRAHTNCQKCGAVLLGVDPIDFNQMARAVGGTVEVQPRGKGQPRLERLPARAAQRRPAAAAKPKKGGFGCLWTLFIWGAIGTAVFQSGAGAQLKVAALDGIADLPPPARDALYRLLREFLTESELPAGLMPQPPLLKPPVVRAPAPLPPPTPVEMTPAPPVAPVEPSLPRAPAEVDTAIERAQAKLLRCAALAKPGERVAAVLSIQIEGNRIAGTPILLEPESPSPWTQCWVMVVQRLRLPGKPQAGQYRLELSVAQEPTER